MPEIGFTYNSGEYTFDLTWKQWYITIRPFAIYNGTEYTLKQIIPWLKNNYPNIQYRHAIQKFKNYHRWGYYLERLSPKISDNLDALGFDLDDTNIPLDRFVVEEIEDINGTFKRIHIAERFTFDFYDLIERNFTFDVIGRRVLIGNVSGKSDLDIDPITYSSPTITVTGYTEGSPCTFWDLWNASYINGWNVSCQTCENATTGIGHQDTQFLFNAKIVIGDGSTATWFIDKEKQVVFNDGITTGESQYLIYVRAKANFILGELESLSEKRTAKGCELLILEDTNANIWTIQGEASDEIIYIYDTTIRGIKNDNQPYAFHLIGGSSNKNLRLVNCGLLGVNGVHICHCETIYNIRISDATYGMIRTYSNQFEKIVLSKLSSWDLYLSGGADVTYKNVELIEQADNDQVFCTGSNNMYLIDCVLPWIYTYFSTFTGKVYRQYTFNVVVVDSLGNPIQGAEVSLSYQGQNGGSVGKWTTPANGSLPELVLSKGFYNQTGGNTLYSYEPFNLTIEATGYLPHTQVFNLSEPVNWEVSLVGVEEGIMTIVNMNLELVSFILLGAVFMVWGWTQKAVIPVLLSTIFWFLSSWWWWGSDTIFPQFALAFGAVGVVNILKFLEGVAKIYIYRVEEEDEWLE